jgi:hypothetical protein
MTVKEQTEQLGNTIIHWWVEIEETIAKSVSWKKWLKYGIIYLLNSIWFVSEDNYDTEKRCCSWSRKTKQPTCKGVLSVRIYLIGGSCDCSVNWIVYRARTNCTNKSHRKKKEVLYDKDRKVKSGWTFGNYD